MNSPVPRRGALLAVIAAPITLHLQLSAPLPASASSTDAITTGRLLTPAEKRILEGAFAAALPKAKAPVVLRLVFHDAGTYDRAAKDGGANASIEFELDRPENGGLKRGWNVVNTIYSKLKGTPLEGVLSRADVIALAGAHAVRITGGPLIDVPIGRTDAQQGDPLNRLPDEKLSATEQIVVFESKGLNPQELVALLGSHTLGGKGFGDPLTFDNQYYSSLLDKPWENKADDMAVMIGLPSDHVLPDDPTCRPYIERYANDQDAFHEDFKAAYLKLTSLGAQWRADV